MDRQKPSLCGTIATTHRLATDDDVLLWSYGEVAVKSRANASQFELRSTLCDQCIFGSAQHLSCACGKYRGECCSGMVCDTCYVTVSSADARWARLGHITLRAKIPHPLADGDETLSVFPVIPAAFRDSENGPGLCAQYESILDLSEAAAIAQAIDRLICLIFPLALQAVGWNLSDQLALTRAVALARRENHFN